MAKDRVVIIGNTPGVCVCAIYLFTANVPVTVIRTDRQYDLPCSFVAGLPGISYQEFLDRSFEQAVHMKIPVITASEFSVEYISQKNSYAVSVPDEEIEGRFLVVSSREEYAPGSDKGFFSIDDVSEMKEAVVEAGAGCKVAFSIKEVVC